MCLVEGRPSALMDGCMEWTQTPKNKTTFCGRGNDCFGSTFRVYHLSIAVPNARRHRVLKPKWGMRETFINPLTLPVQLTLLLLSLNWRLAKVYLTEANLAILVLLLIWPKLIESKLNRIDQVDQI